MSSTLEGWSASEKVRAFFRELPTKSAVKHALLKHFFDGMSATAVSAFLGEDRFPRGTVAAYLSTQADESVLNMAEKRGVKRPRALEQMRVAVQWLGDTCGRTLSGRHLDTKRTSLSRHGLYQKYAKEHVAPLSEATFRRLAKKQRVRFGVGPVDTFTCELCRLWRTELKSLAGATSKRDLERLALLQRLLDDHNMADIKQRSAYGDHLARVLYDESFGIIVLDFSHISLSNSTYS